MQLGDFQNKVSGTSMDFQPGDFVKLKVVSAGVAGYEHDSVFQVIREVEQNVYVSAPDSGRELVFSKDFLEKVVLKG